MCGIAGFIDPNTAPAERSAAVERMCAAMLRRGPDDGGFAERGEASLGMRRLAIFDPAHGHQPMVTPDGRYTLIFNGAIYNHQALRAELAGGWTFRTHCDTEVLLAAFARWGEGCLDRLRGMYAFAVWDAQAASLFLARDPFGIKPLYFRHDGSRLLFASELNALIAAGAGAVEIDPRAVADYLAWFSVPAPRTIYRNLFTLRPGECARFRGGDLGIRRTWAFPAKGPTAQAAGSRADFVRALRAQLEDSIRAHLLADVPVGAFLSGGLDSAVIVGLMSRVGGARLRTFSIGFEEAGYSEAEEAAASARHFGAEHHARIVTGAEVAGDVENFLAACDQPTGDGLNTYYASEAAHAGGVKVALSGLGGDELFGGYPSFRDLPRLSAYLPWWRRLPGRCAGSRCGACAGATPAGASWPIFSSTPGTAMTWRRCSGGSSPSRAAGPCSAPACANPWANSSPSIRSLAPCGPKRPRRATRNWRAPGKRAPTWPTCCCATAT